MRDPCGGGNILSLECINIKILVVTAQCCLAKCYHRHELGKGYMGSLYCFLQPHVNYNYLQINIIKFKKAGAAQSPQPWQDLE